MGSMVLDAQRIRRVLLGTWTLDPWDLDMDPETLNLDPGCNVRGSPYRGRLLKYSDTLAKTHVT